MRIKSINIPEDQCQDGIKGIKMDRLGDVVILAGKNGSGKTRLINILRSKVNNAHKNLQALNTRHIQYIKYLNDAIKKYELDCIMKNESLFIDESYLGLNIYLNMIYEPPISNELMVKNRHQTIKNNNMEIIKETASRYSEEINRRIQVYTDLGVFFSEGNISDIVFLEFVPKSTQLNTVASVTHSQSIISYSRVYSSLSNVNEALIDIKSIQDTYFNSSHPETRIDDIALNKISIRYRRLQDTFLRNMNFTLGRDSQGNTLMNDIVLTPSVLSDGQKILLQIIVGLHKFQSDLKNVILIMDEPENHLHPSALIDFFNLIKESVPFSQIFIATHSVPLLAYFGVENIWYVEDGTVSYAGKTPQRVLEGLLGDENQINRLRALCDSPAHFAMLDFACECLTPPGVVMTDSKDPQNTQISEVLAKIEAENISILDYGCGKARLLANISEAMGREAFVNRYSYAGFDKYAEDKEVAESVIAGVYGNSDNRYFNDEGKLKAEVGEGTVDVIIMCNVLHEIPPQEWGNLFGTIGLISKMLKPDGYLLVVEDMCLTHGEVAHQYGFLVLGTNELMKLFNVTGRRPDDFIVNSQKEDRLLAHLIPKQYVVGYTPKGRKAAISELKTNAQNKLKLIKSQNGTLAKQPKEEQQKLGLKLGHEYAFWVHQYTNADLALAEL